MVTGALLVTFCYWSLSSVGSFTQTV